MAKRQFRKFKHSHIKALVVDEEGNLSIDFGDKRKDKFAAFDIVDRLTHDSNLITEDGTLPEGNQNVVITIPNTTIFMYIAPKNNDTINLVNDSGGSVIIDGNGNNIHDLGTFELLNTESLILMFNNFKWNIV